MKYLIFPVFAFSFFLASNAEALSCLPPNPAKPLSERVDEYETIFLGTIGSFLERSKWNDSDPFGGGSREQYSVYEIEPTEAFKGVKLGSRLKLKTLATAWHVWAMADGSIPQYTKGDEYIVLAGPITEGVVQTPMNPDCSNDMVLINMDWEEGPKRLSELQSIFATEETEAPKAKSGTSFWEKIKAFFAGLFK